MAEQVRTKQVSISKIMASPFFRRGLEDARSGKPFDWCIGGDVSSGANDSWSYERGRLFGHIAPLDMPLRIENTLNPRAIALCKLAFERKLIV